MGKKTTESEIINNFIDLNPYAVAFGDKYGHTFRVNKAFIKLFGSAPPPYYNIFEDPNFKDPKYKDLFGRMMKGEIVDFPEIWYNAHNFDPKLPDKEICVHSVVFPVMDEKGEIEYIAGVHEDITERKRLEKIKNEFINIVSHEFRTPLAIVKEGMSRVIEGMHGSVSEDQKKTLTTSRNSIDRLTKVIEGRLEVLQAKITGKTGGGEEI